MADQKLYFDEVDARWTHAAVYVYDGKIVEATQRYGTAVTFLHSYIPTHDILVRRNVSVSSTMRDRIALHAMTQIGTKYPYLFSLAIYSARGLAQRVRPFDVKTYHVCSELFHRTCMEVTGQALQGCPITGLTKPAHLSRTKSLTDVPVRWMTI
jgi:uncharacterized protein YycO